jgi:hypothetical protein
MKKPAPQTSSDGTGSASTRRRMPSRLMKRRLRERLAQDTKLVNQGTIVDIFRKQGYYEELALDELQDRLSKLQSPLAETLMKGRA